MQVASSFTAKTRTSPFGDHDALCVMFMACPHHLALFSHEACAFLFILIVSRPLLLFKATDRRRDLFESWMDSPAIADTPQPFFEGSSGDCLVRALAARGIAYRYLSSGEITTANAARKRVVEFDINGVLFYFVGGTLHLSDPRGAQVPGPKIGGQTARFTWRKDLVKSFLRKYGFSVPEGAPFSHNAQRDAEFYFAALCPSLSGGVCVKPAAAYRGREVFLGIRDLQSFRAAFAAVGEHHMRVLIEEMVPGTVHRFLCLSGHVIAIRIGRPANVEGDGAHTIADLVELKNAERELNPCHAPYPLRLDQRERMFLRKAGLEIDHVPEAGKLVFLDELSNLHKRADIIDVTDAVHKSYVELVEHAISHLPELVLCGPDVVIQDANIPATSHNHHILELNGNGPGFSAHHYPWRGRPRDVAETHRR